MTANNENVSVFLSYAREDTPVIEEVYNKLEAAGFSPWLDVKNIVPGEQWDLAIRKAITTCTFLIIFLSKNSVRKRGYLQKEIKKALDVWEEKLDDDIFIIPIRLEDCESPDSLRRFQWIDYFRENAWEKLYNAIMVGIERLGLEKPVKLRSTALQNVTEDVIIEMVKKHDLFDSRRNPRGKGLPHIFKSTQGANKFEDFVFDELTGLMWQRSGSEHPQSFDQATISIGLINSADLGGYDDWRLPTVEEAVSLPEPNKNKENSLHIDKIFDPTQKYILTSDTHTLPYELGKAVWAVDLVMGECLEGPVDQAAVFMRAVRAAR